MIIAGHKVTKIGGEGNKRENLTYIPPPAKEKRNWSLYYNGGVIVSNVPYPVAKARKIALVKARTHSEQYLIIKPFQRGKK